MTIQLASGHVIDGRYRLQRVLGRGHFGVVFAATQLALGREVAVKLLHHDKSRVLDEARAAGRIDHPNVARVYDLGVDSSTDQPYMVSELVRGETLTGFIRRVAPVEERQWAALVAQAARGLAAAHARGILHNDLKPTNVLVAPLADGELIVKLVDFGHATYAANGRSPHSSGTATFASPELSMGRPTDHRSDLYSLGCLLYAGLEGRAPFVAATAEEIVWKHLYEAPPSVRASTAMQTLVTELLAKDPVHRVSSALEAASRLDAIASAADLRLGLGAA